MTVNAMILHVAWTFALVGTALIFVGALVLVWLVLCNVVNALTPPPGQKWKKSADEPRCRVG